MVESVIVPSQRLLKMLDPLGHLVPHRALASLAPKAVVWAPTPSLAVRVRDELAAAGIEALQATSFHHVATSLRAARPAIELAVVQLSALTEADLATLVAARWAGYRGAIVGVGVAAELPARTRLLVGLELVADIDNAVRDAALAIRARTP